MKKCCYTSVIDKLFLLEKVILVFSCISSKLDGTVKTFISLLFSKDVSIVIFLTALLVHKNFSIHFCKVKHYSITQYFYGLLNIQFHLNLRVTFTTDLSVANNSLFFISFCQFLSLFLLISLPKNI